MIGERGRGRERERERERVLVSGTHHCPDSTICIYEHAVLDLNPPTLNNVPLTDPTLQQLVTDAVVGVVVLATPARPSSTITTEFTLSTRVESESCKKVRESGHA